MTLLELVDVAGKNSAYLSLALILPPVLAFLLNLMHGRDGGKNSPWKYFYTVIVYTVCVPGILAAVLTAYNIFFIHSDLMRVNILVYFLPVISMAVTLIILGKNVGFDNIPGFDRLSGLMTLIAVTFILVLAVEKTRIWLVFGGSLAMLILFVTGLFALLKWGAYMLFRRKDEPKKEMPL